MSMEPEYHLHDWQIKRCLTPPPPSRLEQVQGNTYLPQQECRAELSRTFGIGNWDSQVLQMELLYEMTPEDGVKTSKASGEKPAYDVAYKAAVQLRIRDMDGRAVAEFIEWHIGQNMQPSRAEAHATAMTAAESYALRRAAIGLGDNLGLCLYSKNEENGRPLIKGTPQLLSAALLAGQPEPAAPTPTPSDPETAEAAQRLTESLDAEAVTE